MFAKIAAHLNIHPDEVRAASGISLYTEEEKILEGQSVINYYTWRKDLERLKSEDEDAYKARYDEWRYKTCQGCNDIFAYNYLYDCVSFCSLDCLNTGLRKIGLKVHYGRPLIQRWGYHVPAVVPAPVVKLIQET